MVLRTNDYIIIYKYIYTGSFYCGKLRAHYPGSRGPNAERPGETAKGELWSKGKGLCRPWPLRISPPCSYQVQILNLVSDGHLILLVLYIKPVWPVTIEANQRQGSKSVSNTDMEVRFSTAEARGPSLSFGVFLLLSLQLSPALSSWVRASGTRVRECILLG